MKKSKFTEGQIAYRVAKSVIVSGYQYRRLPRMSSSV